jgi:hypothetical protein
MNEERIRELQEFTEDFNKKIEEAHMRWEKVNIN